VGANIYGTHTVDIVVDDATFVFLQNATSFIISNTDTIPSLNHDILTNALTVNASYPLLNKVNVTIPSALIQNGTTGVIGLNNDFIMYGAESVGSISTNILNSVKYKVRDIIDSSNFTFLANDYAETAETGGGDNVSISSIAHGFNGIQTNEKNGKVFRSINLQGENYVFLCCNKLKGYEDTNNVKNILEKIILDQSPNHVCFKPIEKLITFEQGILPYLQDFEFEVRNWDGSLYDFKDLDYSFTLEITTVQKALKNMNNNRNELTTYKI
jgi:hypothetical protein